MTVDDEDSVYVGGIPYDSTSGETSVHRCCRLRQGESAGVCYFYKSSINYGCNQCHYGRKKSHTIKGFGK